LTISILKKSALKNPKIKNIKQKIINHLNLLNIKEEIKEIRNKKPKTIIRASWIITLKKIPIIKKIQEKRKIFEPDILSNFTNIKRGDNLLLDLLEIIFWIGIYAKESWVNRLSLHLKIL